MENLDRLLEGPLKNLYLKHKASLN
jgi:hypothetical protein